MPLVIRNESDGRLETQSIIAVLAVFLVVALALLLGYFAWWAPAQSTPSIIDRQTVIHDRPANSPTIVTPPASSPPIIIQEQNGAKTGTDKKSDTDSGDNTGKTDTGDSDVSK